MSAKGDHLRVVGGLATLVVGAIHPKQYSDFIKGVPTIGTLFVLNGLGVGLVCVLLAAPRPRGRLAGRHRLGHDGDHEAR